MSDHLQDISESRAVIDALEEERAEKIQARNARLLRMFASGIPTARLATATGMTESSVRKIAALNSAQREEVREVRDGDEVNLDWLHRLRATVDNIDARIAAAHEDRNASIIAASREGIFHSIIADVAGVGRPRIARIVNEA